MMDKKRVASELLIVAKLLLRAEALESKELTPKQEEYQKHFRDTMDEHEVESPTDLSEEGKKNFFDDVDEGWESEDEK